MPPLELAVGKRDVTNAISRRPLFATLSTVLGTLEEEKPPTSQTCLEKEEADQYPEPEETRRQHRILGWELRSLVLNSICFIQ